MVGGGTSGLVAALAADTNSMLGVEKSGLKVLVVERNSFAGGDLNFTGGFIGAPSGTVINEATALPWTRSRLDVLCWRAIRIWQTR